MMSVPFGKFVKPAMALQIKRKLMCQLFKEFHGCEVRCKPRLNHAPGLTPSSWRYLQMKELQSRCTTITNSSQYYSTSADDDSSKKDKSEENVAPSVPVTGLDDCTLSLTEEEVQKLTKGDPELIKKIRFIQLEHEVLRQEGILVPTKPIKLSRWEELITLNSRTKRKRYFEFLFKLEKTKENDLKKKEERKQKRLEMLESLPELPPLGQDPDGMIYGLNRNTMFVRLRDDREFAFYHGRLIQEMLFGQPLIFDCGYCEHMSQREQKNCANQLQFVFARNRVHPWPFDLRFCNMSDEDHLYKYLQRMIPTINEPHFPLNVTSESYLDTFPRERLIYLTPHAKDELLEFNPDEIYIIGAMVDKSDPRPFSLAKAKKENLPMKKLPLDTYLDWGMGHKSLTLDQMINIMLDVRFHNNDWNKALEHVPRRKLRNFGQDEENSFEYKVAKARGIRGRVEPPPYVSRSTYTGSPYSKSSDFNPTGFHRPSPRGNYNNLPDLEIETDEFSGFRKPRYRNPNSSTSERPGRDTPPRADYQRRRPDLRNILHDD